MLKLCVVSHHFYYTKSIKKTEDLHEKKISAENVFEKINNVITKLENLAAVGDNFNDLICVEYVSKCNTHFNCLQLQIDQNN